MEMYVLEYELASKRAEAEFEFAMDQAAIMEFATMLESEGADAPASKNKIAEIKEAVKEFFKKLRDALIEFVANVKLKIDTAIRTHQLKQSLKKIKEEMAHMKTYHIADKKIRVKSYKNLIDKYNRFISMSVKSINKYTHIRYTDGDALIDELNALEKNLQEYITMNGLDEIECEVLSMSMDEFIKYSEKEIEIYSSNIRLIEDAQKAALAAAEEASRKAIEEFNRKYEEEMSKVNPVIRAIKNVGSVANRIANSVLGQIAASFIAMIVAVEAMDRAMLL